MPFVGIDHTTAFAIDAPAKASDMQKLDQNVDYHQGLFDGGTGHGHTGGADDGPEITALVPGAARGTCFLGIRDMPQGATRYFANLGQTANATEANCKYSPPGPITIKDLWVSANTAPASGQTITVTLRKNGVDTGLTAQITNAATKVSDLVNSVSFNKDDEISWKAVSTASIGTGIDIVMSYRHVYHGTDHGWGIIPYNVDITGSFGYAYGLNSVTTNVNGGFYVGSELIITDYVNKHSSASPGGTGPNFLVDLAAAAGPDVFFGSNQHVSFRHYNGTGRMYGSLSIGNINPAGVHVGGLGLLCFENVNQPQNTTAYMQGVGETYRTVESEVQIPVTAGTLQNLHIKSLAAVPAGQTWQVTVRKNGADTAITATITGTGTEAADTTNTVIVADGDLVSLKCVSSATTGSSLILASVEHVD